MVEIHACAGLRGVSAYQLLSCWRNTFQCGKVDLGLAASAIDPDALCDAILVLPHLHMHDVDVHIPFWVCNSIM